MAYLEITLQVDPADRVAAAGVYKKYKQPFLGTVPGATSKELLVRDEAPRSSTASRPWPMRRRTRPATRSRATWSAGRPHD
jgi:hypothetical protein